MQRAKHLSLEHPTRNTTARPCLAASCLPTAEKRCNQIGSPIYCVCASSGRLILSYLLSDKFRTTICRPPSDGVGS